MLRSPESREELPENIKTDDLLAKMVNIDFGLKPESIESTNRNYQQITQKIQMFQLSSGEGETSVENTEHEESLTETKLTIP